VTEAPAPHFISSRLRSLFLENTHVFDMRSATHFQIKVWSGTMTGRILYGETPLDLIEAYTEYAGRMRVLPDWVHNGVIVASQGGMQAANKKLAELRQASVPLAGFWIQDWVGIRVTSAGQQLWWDWRLDENYYPQWRELVADLEKDGARMLIYINPFLSNAAGHDALFKEAQANGYLVKKADDSPYLIKNTDFFAASRSQQSGNADLDQGDHQDRAYRQGRRFARPSKKRAAATTLCSSTAPVSRRARNSRPCSGSAIRWRPGTNTTVSRLPSSG
jgi:alpha-glucosidase